MPRQARTVPWLAKRDNGVWYAHWYDASARRERRTSLDTADDNEATRRFAVWLIERQSGGSGQHVGVTVHWCLDFYDKTHVTEHVIDKERQRDAMANLKAFFGSAFKMKDVTVAQSQAYAKARQDGLIGGGERRKNKAGSNATIRRELVVLVAAANRCAKHDKLPLTELPRVELPAEPPAEEIKWLTKEQLRLAFASVGEDDRDFLQVLYFTGARRRSVERLLKVQVDLKNDRINLHPPGARRSKKRRPIVPIYPEIRAAIERQMNKSETVWVFGSPRDRYRDFCEIMADVGIDAHPHMLRHSRATHMLQDGEDVYKVAGLLGDTVATVTKVYGHFCPDYLATRSTIGEVA